MAENALHDCCCRPQDHPTVPAVVDDAAAAAVETFHEEVALLVDGIDPVEDLGAVVAVDEIAAAVSDRRESPAAD